MSANYTANKNFMCRKEKHNKSQPNKRKTTIIRNYFFFSLAYLLQFTSIGATFFASFYVFVCCVLCVIAFAIAYSFSLIVYF